MIEAKYQLSKSQDLFILTIAKDEELTLPEVDAIFKNVLQQLSGGNNEREQQIDMVGVSDKDVPSTDPGPESDNAAGS